MINSILIPLSITYGAFYRINVGAWKREYDIDTSKGLMGVLIFILLVALAVFSIINRVFVLNIMINPNWIIPISIPFFLLSHYLFSTKKVHHSYLNNEMHYIGKRSSLYKFITIILWVGSITIFSIIYP